MKREPIYLDNNATTALDPEVLAAMSPYWLRPGNAESRHAAGRAARRGWEEARQVVAEILGADPSEVIFTSGGTEANNLAVFGLAGLRLRAGIEEDVESGSRPPLGSGRIVASPIEHPAVAEPLAHLEADGVVVERPSVSAQGVADADRMSEVLRDDTLLATLILANNETGAIQPVARLAEHCARLGVPVHTDAVQAVGRIPVDFHALGVATLAASAHKFHGPVGVGVLLVRAGSGSAPGSSAAASNRGVGPGPSPSPSPSASPPPSNAGTTRRSAHEPLANPPRPLRSRLIDALGPDRVVPNGPSPDDPGARLPQTTNLGFPGLDGDALLMQLDLAGIAASLGSACASGSTRPSPTLLAMRVPDDRLRSSVRFSLGAETSESQIDDACDRIITIVRR